MHPRTRSRIFIPRRRPPRASRSGPNHACHRTQRGFPIPIRPAARGGPGPRLALGRFLDLPRNAVESRCNVGAQCRQRRDCRNRNRGQNEGIFGVPLAIDLDHSEIRTEDATPDVFHCLSPFSKVIAGTAGRTEVRPGAVAGTPCRLRLSFPDLSRIRLSSYACLDLTGKSVEGTADIGAKQLQCHECGYSD